MQCNQNCQIPYYHYNCIHMGTLLVGNYTGNLSFISKKKKTQNESNEESIIIHYSVTLSFKKNVFKPMSQMVTIRAQGVQLVHVGGRTPPWPNELSVSSPLRLSVMDGSSGGLGE